ncbi:MAG: ABC transporter permease [Caldilineaceae bacterium]|nr:ABC transporter permease [Caldilineaceae bacterium]
MSAQDSEIGSGQAALAEQATLSTGEYIQGYLKRVRGGELGTLPIIIGLVLIALIFQSLNQNYLTPVNFVNLIVQSAGIATIAVGVVFVLLLGEIDLSIGFVSAVCGVVMTIIFKELGWPWMVTIPAALIVVTFIGLVQGMIITGFGLPSFIVTLAGLLVWNGVVLILVGAGGTIILQDAVAVGIANAFLPDEWGWGLAIAIIIAYAAATLLANRTRRVEGLTTTPMPLIIAQIVLVALFIVGAVYVCNQDRGVPFVGVLLAIFLVLFSFIATRTPFGRYVYAVGGSAEAARRAGISVDRIRVIVFMLSSFMAGWGGIILASRLRSVATNSGGGNLVLNCIAAAVIGGTSLFGGRGRVVSALLGALVVGSVENGMGLLGLSAGAKFIITGLVLLAAVLVDALARRSRVRAGRA